MNEPNSRARTQQAIRNLGTSACELWQRYLNVGPGALDASALDEFSNAASEARSTLAAQADTEQMHDELIRVLDTLEPLLRRCVERTEGLCFVTGEAGLIPRKDLHEKCENALAFFEDFLNDET